MSKENRNRVVAQKKRVSILKKIEKDDSDIKMNKGISNAIERLVEKEEFLSTDQFIETACHEFLIRHDIEIWGQPRS